MKSPTYQRITTIALGLSDTTFFNSPLDDAVDISIKEGIQLVDEQGDRIFG